MQSWIDKLNGSKPPQIKRLEKAVAGMPAGASLYISSPLEIDAYINTVPEGRIVAVKRMRDELARRSGADHTCPMTTGLFLRIVAEAAFEKLNHGGASTITPFWRVIEPGSAIARRLSFGADFISSRRDLEAGDTPRR